MKIQTDVFRRYPTAEGYTTQKLGLSPEAITNIVKSPSDIARKNLVFVVGQTAYSLDEYKQLTDDSKLASIRKPRIKPEIKAEIVKLEAKGFSCRSISKMLGVSVATVSRTLKNVLK